ncbi:uncharacterized protein GIQ15_06922 [Arthroderma uncinatum]|uniref:uncharacterized protein n=1 Tax=Arthroderma uncinatum TaxID=74035 RepID=UPI00144AA090|nr:uncharacterized protein GIQ15_06922 [Arthroderma uncinatum]KAF3479946.1 hypothetical protein GIQ15_06922 [Arthroderma uncinatum]
MSSVKPSYMDLIRQNGSFTPGSSSNIKQDARTSLSMQAQAGSLPANDNHKQKGQKASRASAPPTGNMAYDLQGIGSWADKG